MKNEWSFYGSVVVSLLEFESICVSGLLLLQFVSDCIKVLFIAVRSIVEKVVADRVESLEIIVLVDWEGGLIGAVEMTVGKERDGFATITAWSWW